MTSPRQLGLVLDLNKCIGCQSCTIACKRLWTDDGGMEHMWWNIVNTMPGRGTPRDWESMGGGFRNGVAQPGRLPTQQEFGEAWEFNYEEVFYGGKGGSARLQPKGRAPEWGPNWDEDQGGGAYPNSYYFYLPRICNHCANPACLEACPRKAIQKREEDGIVLIDEDRCRGYRFCMEACPYKKIYFNHAERLSQKCIFCFPRVEMGVAPACARQCPGRVRFVGYRDDRAGPIYKLVDQWRVALPLHPEYETEPNVFYVPPILPARIADDGSVDEPAPRIPNEYLVSLFGSEVIDVLAKLQAEMGRKRRGEGSEILDTLIAYEWKQMFGGLDHDPSALDRQPIRIQQVERDGRAQE
jgi:ethylbenzene hydroxylase subunit beta/complex iron-sulfur molybdoenzyme family reductase subunit beta